MTIQTIPVGMLSTNCYLAYRDPAAAVIVDPGDDPRAILAAVKAVGATVKAILLTHGHFDHILAARALADALNAPVVALREEAPILADPGLNLSRIYVEETALTADRLVDDGEILSFDGLTCRVIHTPGHTAGGCCYFFEKEGILFSGDTLFFHSHGRTDSPTGSDGAMAASLRQLLSIEGDATVYPGHGEPTSLTDERRFWRYGGDGV
ncbi:MAG: MBL fold metallo-hydrolase [Acutalibacteraceae bacterium]|jgi:hydroxyacylglutathione hydrolase